MKKKILALFLLIVLTACTIYYFKFAQNKPNCDIFKIDSLDKSSSKVDKDKYEKVDIKTLISSGDKYIGKRVMIRGSLDTVTGESPYKTYFFGYSDKSTKDIVYIAMCREMLDNRSLTKLSSIEGLSTDLIVYGKYLGLNPNINGEVIGKKYDVYNSPIINLEGVELIRESYKEVSTKDVFSGNTLKEEYGYKNIKFRGRFKRISKEERYYYGYFIPSKDKEKVIRVNLGENYKKFDVDEVHEFEVYGKFSFLEELSNNESYGFLLDGVVKIQP